MLRKVWETLGEDAWVAVDESSVHKPCLARAAETSSARVSNCGDSIMLRLPEEDRWLSRRRGGDSSPDRPGDWMTISAPWSTLALAWSRNVSLWLSIYSIKLVWKEKEHIFISCQIFSKMNDTLDLSESALERLQMVSKCHRNLFYWLQSQPVSFNVVLSRSEYPINLTWIDIIY